jgi:hypothetical protein
MRQYLHGGRSRGRGRLLALASAGALGVSLLVASPVGAGGKAGFGCPPAFDIGPVTLTQTLELPRIQAGLAAGAFTAADIESLFDAIDHNGDGILCLQDLGALNGGASQWQYFYNGVDNNASVPDS